MNTERYNRVNEYIQEHPEFEEMLKTPYRRKDKADILALGGEYDDGVGKIRYKTREDAMRALAECRKAKGNGSKRRAEKRVYFENGGWYLTSHNTGRKSKIGKYKARNQHSIGLLDTKKKTNRNKKRLVRTSIYE